VKTSTETLIKAMRILSSDIQSDDGVANAAIAEAAQRLEEQKDRIKRLEEENDSMRADLLLWGDNLRLQQRINRLEEENDALRADLLLWNEKEVKP
jgi:uncharacterized protein (UPF0335 family)